MAEKLAAFGAETMRNIEKQLLLQTIDAKWREHLVTLEHLRSVVGFRGYAQRDPLNEYKTEGFHAVRKHAELAAAGGDAEAGAGPSADRGRAAGDDGAVHGAAGSRAGGGRGAGAPRGSCGSGGCGCGCGAAPGGGH